jgi:prolyl-tRNA editing enzyme YbaK/EbsC (Cys-tRNA(Pro) deacylase)
MSRPASRIAARSRSPISDRIQASASGFRIRVARKSCSILRRTAAGIRRLPSARPGTTAGTISSGIPARERPRKFRDVAQSTSPATRRVEEEAIAQRVLDELSRLGLPYERILIDPEHADTASFCEKYGYPLDRSANTIIVGSKKEPKRYAACVIRADARLDVNHAVKRLLGVSRLSFAKPEETMELTGMAIGGVTVLALPKDLPIYVDNRLMELDYVILGSGDRSAKIKTSPEVFRRLPSVQIVADLAMATSRA